MEPKVGDTFTLVTTGRVLNNHKDTSCLIVELDREKLYGRATTEKLHFAKDDPRLTFDKKVTVELTKEDVISAAKICTRAWNLFYGHSYKPHEEIFNCIPCKIVEEWKNNG